MIWPESDTPNSAKPRAPLFFIKCLKYKEHNYISKRQKRGTDDAILTGVPTLLWTYTWRMQAMANVYKQFCFSEHTATLELSILISVIFIFRNPSFIGNGVSPPCTNYCKFQLPFFCTAGERENYIWNKDLMKCPVISCSIFQNLAEKENFCCMFAFGFFQVENISRKVRRHETQCSVCIFHTKSTAKKHLFGNNLHRNTSGKRSWWFIFHAAFFISITIHRHAFFQPPSIPSVIAKFSVSTCVHVVLCYQ